MTRTPGSVAAHTATAGVSSTPRPSPMTPEARHPNAVVAPAISIARSPGARGHVRVGVGDEDAEQVGAAPVQRRRRRRHGGLRGREEVGSLGESVAEVGHASSMDTRPGGETRPVPPG